MINYNFAVETLSFTGREIGIQQSVREIPGFLSFAAVIFLFWFREQTFAYISLLLLGAAGALTGYFPSFWGFLIITFVSSVGFHYYETMAQSLQLQLLPKATAPSIMGKILAVGAFSQLVAFSIVCTIVLVSSASAADALDEKLEREQWKEQVGKKVASTKREGSAFGNSELVSLVFRRQQFSSIVPIESPLRRIVCFQCKTKTRHQLSTHTQSLQESHQNQEHDR